MLTLPFSLTCASPLFRRVRRVRRVRCAAAVVLLGGLWAPVASAQADQTLNLIADTVAAYLRTQTQGLPGQVSHTLGQLDPRAQIGPCVAMEPFTPSGSRLWGRSTVGLRCLSPSVWTIYLPVHIHVRGPYYVTARSLTPGHRVEDGDLAQRSGDLTTLPAGVVIAPEQALGKTMKNAVAAGQPLRADQLLAPLVVQQGQSVRLITKGQGFSASSEGKALNNASEGQVVQARVNSGQVVSGVAREGGVVEINY